MSAPSILELTTSMSAAPPTTIPWAVAAPVFVELLFGTISFCGTISKFG